MAADNTKPRIRLKAVQAASDGLVNVVSGLGGNKSKSSHNEWQYDLLNNWQQLDAAYQTNWIARQIVDVTANDMTREWRRIKAKDAEVIESIENELSVQHHVNTAIAWARLFGGAGILMCTGQDLGKPLKVNQIKKGDLRKLLVFDRWELSATQYNTYDVMADNYLMPEFYIIQGGTQQVHHSHVIRFYGERLPRRQMAQVQGWGDSVLRKCITDVADIVAAKMGISELMQEANVDIIKREGLSDDLASDQDNAIIDRYTLFSMMKSNIQMALLDGDEEYDRKTLNLSGVAPILEIDMAWISGAAKTPVTKLFGTSAQGMNATGDGDLQNYYDDIRSEQLTLGLSMRHLDEVLVRSAVGSFPDDYDYVWNPLSKEDEVATEQANLLRAQKSTIYLAENIIQKSQVMRELQASEEYQFEDGAIDEVEENEDANLFEDLPDITPPNLDEPEVDIDADIDK